MSFDKYQITATNELLAPVRSDFGVTPSDSVELVILPRCLFIGTGGTLVVRLIGSTSTSTYKNIPSGTMLPIRPQYVYATGTTATDIIGCI